MRLRVESVGARGDGVGIADGTPAYIPYTVAGDVVDAKLCGDRGEVINFVEKGPGRAAPICDYFGRCGGCTLQHMGQETYADWKRGLVVNTLARAGVAESVIGPLEACPVASRRRASFAARKTQNGLVFGFNRRHGKEIIDLNHCPVLAPELARQIPPLRRLAEAIDLASFDMAVTLFDNGIDVEIRSDEEAEPFMLASETTGAAMDAARVIRLTLDGAPVLEFEKPLLAFGGAQVTPPPGGFLQASREGEAALIRFVREGVDGAKRIADLFCGCGTFCLSLGGAAAIDAFDSDDDAIAALADASRSSQFKFPLNAQTRNLFDRPVMAQELNKYDAVIFDPPRAGAQAQAREIAASKVKTVIGVSCSPQSFARDASILLAGGYRLTRVAPVDQFLFAAHVELVGFFKKD